MTIPAFLTGAAGRARVALQPLETMATHVDGVLGGAKHMAGGDIGLQVTGSRTWLLPKEARALINGAEPELRGALGRGKPGFSAELHAAARNLDSSIESMSRGGIAPPSDRLLGTARAASNDIHAAMSELDGAAATTARFRIAGAGFGAVAALGGALALAHRAGGGDDHVIAPGPIGFHPNPEHQY